MRIRRSHFCGVVTQADTGKEVALCGWVDRWRDHGGVTFIDLRDREGVVQIVFDPADFVIKDAHTLRNEFVIGVKGKVRNRPTGMENENLPTGKVEVLIEDLEILNRAETTPFVLHDDSPTQGETSEALRATYRYLDLRRPELQKNLWIRHNFLKATREFYYSRGFIEIETPILYKSTPEGARDYLVPSRLSPGKFYALPQSPQTLKQLCMLSGFDRYVQIARCFRDEDLRADRQPEFTQIDVEMAFIHQQDIFEMHEQLVQKIFKDVLDEEVSIPFQRISYAKAMEKYGSDKPDLRNSLTLVDLSEAGKKCEFQVFCKVLEGGGILKGLCIEDKGTLTRSQLDALPKQVAPFGAKGLSWIRIKEPGQWQGPQAKYFSDELKKEVESHLPYTKDAMLFMVCADPKVTNNSLGYLRMEMGKRLGYFNEEKFNFLWVTDFPLFEYNEEDKRFYASHHPFTSPHPEDMDLFMKGKAEDIPRVRSNAYDMVINGCEVGGGSIRIHDTDVQSRMFELLQISPEEAQEKFGFFLQALKYGTPPHGGIAFGVDRIAMILAGTDAIRDVIAFPKTQRATCLMSGTPSEVAPAQLEELGIRIKKTKG